MLGAACSKECVRYWANMESRFFAVRIIPSLLLILSYSSIINVM